MNTLTLQSVVTRNAEIVTADMDGETVMLNIEMGKYYNLGKTGSAIWALLETPLTVEALIGKLLDAFDVERDQCKTEVLTFLSDTVENGLVTVAPEA